MIRSLFLFLLFLSTHSFADNHDRGWLQKFNPEQLNYWTFSEDTCEIETKELDNLVEGIMLHSIEKPKRLKMDDNLALYVSLECTLQDEQPTLYALQVFFGVINGEFNKPMFFILDYGTVGLGPKSKMITAIRISVDRAMDDYVKANFKQE